MGRRPILQLGGRFAVRPDNQDFMTMQSSSPGVPVPVNTSAPTISGTAQVGETLTAAPGSWDGDPTGFAYQWQRGTTDIAGATGQTYVPVEGDVGETIRVRVIATNEGGDSDPAFSAATDPVIAAYTAPVNTAPPALAPQVPMLNLAVTADPGSWQSGLPVTYAYRYQSSADGSTWSDIAGETGSAITPDFPLRQLQLRVGVIATNDVGSSDEVFSAPTDRVAPYDFEIYAGEYGGPPGDTGYGAGMMGDILSAQPIPGHDLQALFARPEGYGNIAFDGDCVATVEGLVLVLGGSVPSTWEGQGEFSINGGETQCIVESVTAFPMDAPTTVTWAERPPPPVWQSFSLTAAPGDLGVGYANFLGFEYGSIDREAYTGAEIVYFAGADGTIAVGFAGNIVSELEGYTFSIDGVPAVVSRAVAYNSSQDTTTLNIEADIVDGQAYAIERVPVA